MKKILTLDTAIIYAKQYPEYKDWENALIKDGWNEKDIIPQRWFDAKECISLSNS